MTTEAFETARPDARLSTTGGGFCVLSAVSARGWTDWRAHWSEDDPLAFAWRLADTAIGSVLRINPECQHATMWRTAVGAFVMFLAFGKIDVQRAFERTRRNGALVRLLAAPGSHDLVILDEWFPYREQALSEHALVLRTRAEAAAALRLLEVEEEGGYAICLALE